MKERVCRDTSAVYEDWEDTVRVTDAPEATSDVSFTVKVATPLASTEEEREVRVAIASSWQEEGGVKWKPGTHTHVRPAGTALARLHAQEEVCWLNAWPEGQEEGEGDVVTVGVIVTVPVPVALGLPEGVTVPVRVTVEDAVTVKVEEGDVVALTVGVTVAVAVAVNVDVVV